MVTCDQLEKVASSPKVSLQPTVYEWLEINSHPMSRPTGTWPGLYKKIVVTGDMWEEVNLL